MTPAAAAAGLEAGTLVLIDVREPGEFAAGHAPGARNVPLASVGSAVDGLKGETTAIAFVCKSGMRSAAGVSAAKKAGLDVHNVKGGMLAWERAGLPTERGSKSTRRSRR